MREGGYMGAVTKFKSEARNNQFRHVLRKNSGYKNADIDTDKSYLNYTLEPERKETPEQYLKKRLSEVHVMNRADVNEMAGWIITAPADIKPEIEKDFFKACYEFVADRYGGEKNIVTAAVHKDESGEPHMHILFTPITEYTPSKNLVNVVRYYEEHGRDVSVSQVARDIGCSRKTVRRYRDKTKSDIKYEKLSYDSVLTRKDLVTFHPDLQKYLNKQGIDAKVHTGITKKNGGNMTVKQLKMQRDYLMEHGTDINSVVEHISDMNTEHVTVENEIEI